MPDTQQPKSMTSFLMIWVGQIFSVIGSIVVQFALVWWVTKLTGSATVLATASIAAILPGVLLGPIAGAYVDRWNRRLVMIIADGLIALVSLWLAYLFWSGQMQVWHVYVVMLARAVGGSFHWPAMQASISLIVPEEHLTRAAGLNQTLMGVQNIIGPPLGALLLGLLPLYGVMLVDVGTAALAILPLLFVHIPQPSAVARPASDDASIVAPVRSSIWADVRQGLSYVWNWPGLRLVVMMAVIINFVLVPATSLTPLLITEHFKGQAIELGWLNSAWGIGVVLGGLVLSVWGGFRRRVYTSLAGLTLLGGGFTMVGLAPATAFWLAIAGNFLAGFMNPITNGPLFAVLQATVAPEMQGRVFTVLGSLTSAMAPVSLAIAGPIADMVGVRAWYVVGGLMCVVLGVGAAFVPAIVNLEHDRYPLSRAVSGLPIDVPTTTRRPFEGC